jgi:DnaJ-class molecular chaperone
VKEYKTVGPTANISETDSKCPACPGDGKRMQPGSSPETCSVCSGTGKVAGLVKQLNDAAAEGWTVSTHTMVGHPAINHLVIMERDKP